MIENIEEKSNHSFGVYFSPSPAQSSQNHTIHKTNTKQRPWTGTMRKQLRIHPKQDSILQNQNNNPLPLLGKKCRTSEPHHFQESSIGYKSSKEQHLIKRIQFSQLMGRQQHHMTRCNYKKQTVASKDTVFKWNYAYFGGNKLNKKQKKKGYEGQKMRLKASQQHLNQLYSRYDRIDYSLKLSDVIAPLRSQIIRSKQSKLLSQFE